MLFALSAYFKPDVESRRLAVLEEFNEHLTQRTCRIHLGGPLRDRNGQRIGVLFIVEADNDEHVEAFLAASPYTQAGLYERHDIARFDPEIGSIKY